MRKHHISFKHAFEGLYYNFKTQPNFRIHLIAALAVTILGLYFNIHPWEWLILVFTISLVILAELINTAIESISDLITTEFKKPIKIAKDTSAGMVLFSALSSIVVALIIFTPYII